MSETSRTTSAKTKAATKAPRLNQPRVIAMINQKGGVGKTTTTVNLGAGLSLLGYRVLMIDLDPQAHMTLHLGLDPDMLDLTVYEMLADPDTTAAEVAQLVKNNIAVLPAQVNLAGVESELAQLAQEGKAQHVLRDKVHALMYPQGKDGPCEFDFVILDCPPSLGLLTINALSLATEVLVPMQAHFLALQGLSKLLETVGLVKQGINPSLKVSGVILCMHEGQTVLASEVVNDLTGFFEAARSMSDSPWRDAIVLGPPIRRNIKLAECPSYGQTIYEYEPSCAGAQDYKALVENVAAMNVTSDTSTTPDEAAEPVEPAVPSPQPDAAADDAPQITSSEAPNESPAVAPRHAPKDFPDEPSSRTADDR